MVRPVWLSVTPNRGRQSFVPRPAAVEPPLSKSSIRRPGKNVVDNIINAFSSSSSSLGISPTKHARKSRSPKRENQVTLYIYTIYINHCWVEGRVSGYCMIIYIITCNTWEHGIREWGGKWVCSFLLFMFFRSFCYFRVGGGLGIYVFFFLGFCILGIRW
jgi:hypothetical protein